MPVLALIFLPAAWCGWLAATLAVSLLGLALPLWAALLPAQVGAASGAVYVALVGAGVAAAGNVLLLIDFDRTRPRWWVDNALVALGTLVWLAAGLMVPAGVWWHAFEGRPLAALLLAPQVAALLSGIKAADDSGLVTFLKLLAVVAMLALLQAGVLWWLPR